MRRSITSRPGMILFVMLRSSPLLLLSAVGGVRSASLIKRTISSNLVRDIDHGHQTGKSGSSIDGLRHYLTHVLLTKFAVSGSHTGPSVTNLWVRS
uniref:Catalase n=1 Tax=Rhizophora mucronata TaxID=61149 RepID=A0A2P2MJ89_RHIMU